ncbi:MAG: Cu(I)/Ag(I) efflux system membrane fusion protein, partial [Candidatus Paceibacteria bacterium]
MNIKKGILYVFAVVVLLGVGRWSASWGSPPEVGHEPGHEQPMAGEEVAAIWTCPMHPQIQLPEFGDCPICGMDLVAMVAGEELPHQLSMSESAKELSRIMTVRVGRKLVQRSVRMVGKIDFDESTVRTISAWVPGRIDRMYVDYTGVRVQQGDHLVSLFSPELLSAQEELLAARARLKATAGEASEFLASSNRRAYKTAREKLILWGLTEVQVSEIEDRGTAEDHMMLTSASSGVVTEKFLAEGSYVQTGTKLYQIADLHHLWVRLDAYEQDLTWLRYGQDVTLEAEAFPGEVIRGRISFIDFEIDANTRTAKVRVNV